MTRGTHSPTNCPVVSRIVPCFEQTFPCTDKRLRALDVGCVPAAAEHSLLKVFAVRGVALKYRARLLKHGLRWIHPRPGPLGQHLQSAEDGRIAKGRITHHPVVRTADPEDWGPFRTSARPDKLRYFGESALFGPYRPGATKGQFGERTLSPGYC
jgi:hypothetical protein